MKKFSTFLNEVDEMGADIDKVAYDIFSNIISVSGKYDKKTEEFIIDALYDFLEGYKRKFKRVPV